MGGAKKLSKCLVSAFLPYPKKRVKCPVGHTLHHDHHRVACNKTHKCRNQPIRNKYSNNACYVQYVHFLFQTVSDRNMPKVRQGTDAPLERRVAANPQVLPEKERQRRIPQSHTPTPTIWSIQRTTQWALRYQSGQSSIPSSITPPAGRSRHAWPTPIRGPPAGLSTRGPPELRRVCRLTGGWRRRMKRTAVGAKLSGAKQQQKNEDLQVEEVKSGRKIRVIKGGLLWFGHQLLQTEHLLLCSLSAHTHARTYRLIQSEKSNSFFSLKCQWAHQLLPSILKQHN